MTLGVYVVIFLLGKSLKRPSLPSLLGGSILSALLFHIVTCSFSWVMNNAYTKNLAGFWQAQIWGEPGYAPSYLFLRNSIFSTILFTLLFLWVFSKLNNRDKVSEKSFGLQRLEKKIYISMLSSLFAGRFQRHTPVATETLRHSIVPAIGIFINSSQFSAVSLRIPFPSAPTTKAIGPFKLQENILCFCLVGCSN